VPSFCDRPLVHPLSYSLHSGQVSASRRLPVCRCRPGTDGGRVSSLVASAYFLPIHYTLAVPDHKAGLSSRGGQDRRTIPGLRGDQSLLATPEASTAIGAAGQGSEPELRSRWRLDYGPASARPAAGLSGLCHTVQGFLKVVFAQVVRDTQHPSLLSGHEDHLDSLQRLLRSDTWTSCATGLQLSLGEIGQPEI
jgi:hypothetical protein